MIADYKKPYLRAVIFIDNISVNIEVSANNHDIIKSNQI